MTYTRIVGTGSYLPKKILTNAELEKIVDTSDDWIVERTGIKQRHIAENGETAATMAVVAAKQALEMAKINAEDLQLIIVATTTPDKVMPSTACLLQQQLAIPGVPAFDISSACSGFLYALSVADQFIRNNSMRNVLIVGSEVMSSIVNWQDRRTCVLFGDGAGAAVLQASTQPGVLSCHLHADGNYQNSLCVPNALSGDKLPKEPVFIHMLGKEVFRFAVNALSAGLDEALAANQLTREDIDWLVPHQANIRIIKATAKKLNLPMDKVILTVAQHGNTSAASIPLAMDQAVRSGKIQRGQKLLLEAFGGGFTWGSSLVVF